MVTLPLTKGLVAIVDDEDGWVAQWKWTASKGFGANYYAIRRPHIGGREQCILLHRLIVGALPGEDVDELNGDSLDYRRANLRRCSRSEHMQRHAARGGK